MKSFKWRFYAHVRIAADYRDRSADRFKYVRLQETRRILIPDFGRSQESFYIFSSLERN